MTTLLDANVLIALVIDDHVHHNDAQRWFGGTTSRYATCPITEGSLVRTLIRNGQPASTVTTVLAAIAADSRHEFWPDDLSYQQVPLRGVIGHRQVTDTYLAHLARVRGGRLATFDRGFATSHPDIVEHINSGEVPQARTPRKRRK